MTNELDERDDPEAAVPEPAAPPVPQPGFGGDDGFEKYMREYEEATRQTETDGTRWHVRDARLRNILQEKRERRPFKRMR